MCGQNKTAEESKKTPEEEVPPITVPEPAEGSGEEAPPKAADTEETKEVSPPATGETLPAEIKSGDTSEDSTTPPSPNS